MLTLFGPDSGKVRYTKLVYNIDTFLATINTSSSEKQSGSNDLWKVRRCRNLWRDQAIWTDIVLQAYSNGKLTEPRIQGS
jgi:hypothetical protein